MKISTLLAPALCLALAGCDDMALSVVCPGEPQPSQEWVERMAAQEAAATQTN